jgi:hypothetical protein
MSTTHTPGPWAVETYRSAAELLVLIKAPRQGLPVQVAELNPYNRNYEADARLIAAAPELIEFVCDVAEDCRRALSGELDTTEAGLKTTLAAALALIAKATGCAQP